MDIYTCMYVYCRHAQRTVCRAATVVALIVNRPLKMASLSLA